jgi:SNF2 family DNA or RNA helicase
VAVVTPPVAAAAAASCDTADDEEEEQEELSCETVTDDVDEEEDEEDKPIVNLASENSKSRKRKRGDTETDDLMVVRSSGDNDEAQAGEESFTNNEMSSGGVGFFVEYSKTSRATCRRCDLPIEKGQMRVGHKPLFRGQQGFVVYRHLHCAVFPTHIQEGYQLQGYENMSAQHQKAIDLRLLESVREVQEENAEIQPDELLIPSFQGETRPTPPGLAADLLPFQVEGQSWMFAQEHTPYRGGILADEMGMGKTIQTIATILDHRPKLQHCTQSHPKCSPDASHTYRQAVVEEQERWDTAEVDWEKEMKMEEPWSSVLSLPSLNGNRKFKNFVIPTYFLSLFIMGQTVPIKHPNHFLLNTMLY